MSRPAGNTRLKAARLAAGYNSQQALADAITKAAPTLGIRGLAVGVRQIRRWESTTPPWPQPDVHRVLTHLLGQSMEDLGFSPPWGSTRSQPGTAIDNTPRAHLFGARLAAVPAQGGATTQPATVGRDFEAVTRSHRHLYWSVAPSVLHPAALEHARRSSFAHGHPDRETPGASCAVPVSSGKAAPTSDGIGTNGRGPVSRLSFSVFRAGLDGRGPPVIGCRPASAPAPACDNGCPVVCGGPGARRAPHGGVDVWSVAPTAVRAAVTKAAMAGWAPPPARKATLERR